jgi:hypothetical protein
MHVSSKQRPSRSGNYVAASNLRPGDDGEHGLGRSLEQDAVDCGLVAAAGNAGPNSAPLYPGADPGVIAVTATDNRDQLFPGSNRGTYIAVAAPGVDMFAPAPDGAYQLTTGTSVAAAEVSGIFPPLFETRFLQKNSARGRHGRACGAIANHSSARSVRFAPAACQTRKSQN